MNKEVFVNTIFKDEDDYTDEQYEFMYDNEVIDPPACWEIMELTADHITSGITIEIPENDVFAHCEKPHTVEIINTFYSCYGTDLRKGEANIDDVATLEINKVFVDNERCDNNKLDIDQLEQSIYNIIGNGWAPHEMYMA